MSTIAFPAQPNAHNPIGEDAYISECGHFRLVESGGWLWAHWRRSKSRDEQWKEVPGLPFRTRLDAAAACEAVDLKPGRKRRKVS